MRTNILMVIILLLAGNVYAGGGTLSSTNSTGIVNPQSVESENIALIDDVDPKQRLSVLEENYGQLISDLNSYQQELEIKYGEYQKLLTNFKAYKQDTDATLVNMVENNNTNLSELQKKIDLLEALIGGLEEKLTSVINDNKATLTSLQGKTNALGNQIAVQGETLASTIKANRTSLTALQKNEDLLETLITEQKKSSRLDTLSLNRTVGNQKNYFITALVIVLILVIVAFVYLKKQLLSQKDNFEISQRELQQTLKEEGVSLDQKLVELIEKQLAIQADINKTVNAPVIEEPDHSLALKVADEIIRIYKNLLRMDKKTKGLKQLTASVKRIQDNFASNGYELVEMLGEPYKDGLKASVNFISDDDLDEGQQIITRITKPQVNYKGTMIQTAQIEVSQG